MKVSTDNKYSAHFRAARKQLGLTQDGLANALLLSRNYIAQIETGKREPSVRVLSALDSLVDSKRAKTTKPTLIAHRQKFGVQEDVAVFYDTPPMDASAEGLRDAITVHMTSLVAAAGSNVQRLGWIAEQLANHVAEPAHWGMHERIEQQVLAEERLRDQQEKARITQQKSQGAK